MSVILEQRSTAGTVDHDEIGLTGERDDVCFRESLRAAHVTGMLVERPTADLPRGLDHSIAVYFEGSLGGVMHVIEQGVHHAAAEEDDGWIGRRRRRGRRRLRGCRVRPFRLLR